MSANHCGECTMCCKLLAVKELEKPEGQWCANCAIGSGCRIYEIRPRPCRDFACIWLESQSQRSPLPAELRPDRCKMVLSFAENRRDVLGHCDPASPDAWKGQPLRLLEVMSRQGSRVMFGNGRAHFAMDRGRARPVELAPPDDQGIRQFLRFLD
jgi:hypothetical protein